MVLYYLSVYLFGVIVGTYEDSLFLSLSKTGCNIVFNLLSPILQSHHGILCGCIIHEVGEEGKRDVINLDSCCSAFQLTVNGEKKKD